MQKRLNYFCYFRIMKTFYALAFFLVNLKGFAQVTPPTHAYFYDFEVGDSLQYRYGNSGNQSYEYWHIITGKTESASQIEYSIKKIHSTSGVSTTTLIASKISQVDALDTLYMDYTNGDSVFKAQRTEYGEYFSSNWNTYLPCTTNTYYGYIQGLGQIYNGQSTSFDGGGSSGQFLNLIYAHKGSGKVYGHPSYFTVGVYEASDDNSPLLFPNPTTGDFSIQLSRYSEKENRQLRVFNAAGQLLKQTALKQEFNTIKNDGMAKGAYYWQISSEELIIGKGKLVIE